MKFSKISFLLKSLCELTVALTFENFWQFYYALKERDAEVRAYVCMCASMCVWYVCVYVCAYVFAQNIIKRRETPRYVRMYVCVCVCMYVCMCVHIIYIE